MPQAGLGSAAAPHPSALVAQGLARLKEGRRGRTPAQAEEPCTYVPPFLDPPPPKRERGAPQRAPLGHTRGVGYEEGNAQGPTVPLRWSRTLRGEGREGAVNTGRPFTARRAAPRGAASREERLGRKTLTTCSGRWRRPRKTSVQAAGQARRGPAACTRSNRRAVPQAAHGAPEVESGGAGPT